MDKSNHSSGTIAKNIHLWSDKIPQVSNPSDPNVLTAELCNALFAQETNSERITHFKQLSA
jgi:hypothetical protein